MTLFPQLCFLPKFMGWSENSILCLVYPDTLYDLQNIYLKLAERYAADLRRAEADADSDWTEDS
jgi:hypothetical protein